MRTSWQLTYSQKRQTLLRPIIPNKRKFANDKIFLKNQKKAFKSYENKDSVQQKPYYQGKSFKGKQPFKKHPRSEFKQVNNSAYVDHSCEVLVKINNLICAVLLDTGASHCFMDKEEANDLGLKMRPAKLKSTELPTA
eukprot:NODE_42_length_34079_cov_0.552619.p19 type:complete len:138 gc:universal NODE_42_length_34079_cov_0.552619:24102-24515(+)